MQEEKVLGTIQGSSEQRYEVIYEGDTFKELRKTKTPRRIMGKISGDTMRYKVKYDDGTMEFFEGNRKTGIGVCFVRIKGGKTERYETTGYERGWPRP